jgi:hypothetical protein
MILLQAPLPNIRTTTALPNPELNDSVGRAVSLDTKRSMNNVLYTYVKTNQRYKLHFDFVLHRMKALELRAFFSVYYRSKIRLIDHGGNAWEGYFSNNPFELVTTQGEWVQVAIDFEGIRTTTSALGAC